MLLALTGFMGSGKTSVGRIVADALGCPFLDLDEIIERSEGRSIPEIFSLQGEEGFRKLEVSALRSVVGKYAGGGTAVLALGGGTVTIPGAATLLQEKTICIYLKASPETLESRLEGQSASRPLLQDGTSISERLASREKLYQEAAHIILETDDLSPEQVADEIIISCL